MLHACASGIRTRAENPRNHTTSGPLGSRSRCKEHFSPHRRPFRGFFAAREEVPAASPKPHPAPVPTLSSRARARGVIRRPHAKEPLRASVSRKGSVSREAYLASMIRPAQRPRPADPIPGISSIGLTYPYALGGLIRPRTLGGSCRPLHTHPLPLALRPGRVQRANHDECDQGDGEQHPPHGDTSIFSIIAASRKHRTAPHALRRPRWHG